MARVLEEKESDKDEQLARPAWVLLYNDDWHTFDEVSRQLVKAIHCSAAVGDAFAKQVDSEGRAKVFEGAREDCEQVAGILREIRLQVEVDWD
jgi:ATP-dependent Clp protease adaptor protein ClpS